jgi:uncharacterized protein DUF222/HNH endonuclease
MFDPMKARRAADAALDAYPDDPSELKDDEAAAGFAQLQRISEMVEAKRLRWLADQDRRASYRRDGYLSASAWLADRFRVAAGSAKRQTHMAQALERMSRVRECFVAGDVTSSAVHILAEARRAHPMEFAAEEEALVEAATTKPVEELRRVLSEWVQAVDERSPDRAEILRGRRRLDVCPTPTRMVRVDGELDPEGGEAVLTALQAIADADLRAAGNTDMRTPAQRRADALYELARRYLDSSDRPTVVGERPHITVTVDAESLRAANPTSGRFAPPPGELAHTGVVEGTAVRRMACDASVMRVVMAGPSEPLEMGRRTPVVPAALRRAVVLRDQQCRFPACTRPHAWTDAHHVVHWADGGETSLHNLVLLCRPHHRLVHEGGFRLQMVEGKPVFRRPDGSVIEDRRAPP